MVDPNHGPRLLDKRRAGVLLHICSLHTDDGIGNIGRSARDFADWLSSCGLALWQFLPLTPADSGGSPYSSWSAFAGNPLLVDLKDLVEDGLLEDSERLHKTGPSPTVDYDSVAKWKIPLLELAAERLFEGNNSDLLKEFEDYSSKEAAWLCETSLFWALRTRLGDHPWWNWPRNIAMRAPATVASLEKDLAHEISQFKAIQFFFDRQIRQLRAHCEKRGITLIGDIPIYVSANSCDVWANHDLFQLDEERRPTAFGGVPPDYFSILGQNWGTPLYRWKTHEKTEFNWWISRCSKALEQSHIARLDHFRGFCAYWSTSTQTPDARSGEWKTGPGIKLFDSLRKGLGRLPFIAEDLGDIDDNVRLLRDDLNLPGMRIIQFGFGGDSDNEHLPHNHPRDSVVFPGTHDNNTSLGWWRQANDNERLHASQYVGQNGDDRKMAQEIVRLSLASCASWCIVPMQDWLGLDQHSRLNFPGTTNESNWTWRMPQENPGPYLSENISRLVSLYGRRQ